MTEQQEQYEIPEFQTENDTRRDPYNYYGPLMQPDQFAPDSNLLYVNFEHKATIDVGSLKITVDRKFNWFHRTMMRWFFGWKVTNL